MFAAFDPARAPVAQATYVVRVFARWLPLAVAITVTALLVYASVQNVHRSGANDPQQQLVEDAARALAAGVTPQQVVGPTRVPMAMSLAPWLMVVDRGNHVLAASVDLDGRTPELPPGVLEVARREGGNAVTWQPRADVRSATVEVAVRDPRGLVVIAGRSLRDVEARTGRLWLFVCVAWLVAMGGSLVATALGLAIAPE